MLLNMLKVEEPLLSAFKATAPTMQQIVLTTKVNEKLTTVRVTFHVDILK